MKCFWLSLNTSKDISCSNNGIWREARFWEKKNRPLLPLCQQPTCVLHKPMCIHPTKLILWEYKRKPNTCTSKAFCLDYKKFHSAAEGVGRLAHPYARMPTKKNKQKKKKANQQQPNNLHFLNAKFMPHKPGDIFHYFVTLSDNFSHHLPSLNRLILEISQQQALLKGKPPHTHLSL